MIGDASRRAAVVVRGNAWPPRPPRRSPLPADVLACTIYQTVDVCRCPRNARGPLRAALGLPVAGKGAEKPPRRFTIAAIVAHARAAAALGELWARGTPNGN